MHAANSLEPVTLDWLALTPRLARTDRLCGAWWPRSANLVSELGQLLQVVEKRTGPINGILLHRADWPEAPLQVFLPTQHRTRISWYGQQEPNTAILRSSAGRRHQLLLIPHDTPHDHANRALYLASQPGNQHDARTTLTAAATT